MSGEGQYYKDQIRSYLALCLQPPPGFCLSGKTDVGASSCLEVPAAGWSQSEQPTPDWRHSDCELVSVSFVTSERADLQIAVDFLLERGEKKSS